MDSINLAESLQFKITKLSLISTRFGGIDLSNIYQEINIYDSIFTPCINGDILILDAIGIINKLNLDGSEILEVEISKDNETTDTLYKKRFRIYKVSDRKTINSTSEAFLLHFVSEEMITSMQQKIRQAFDGITHTEMAVTIMVNYLNMTGDKFALIEQSKGVYNHVIPNLSPFDALIWLTKRAINEENLPNFLFFENKKGYCFTSLSNLIDQTEIFNINLESKNIIDNRDSQFLGARYMKIVSQYDVLSNMGNGVYSGKFIGFDTLTRKISINQMDYKKTYGLTKKHLNDFPNFRIDGDIVNKFDSKVSLYPMNSYRSKEEYFKNDNLSAKKTDNTQFYVFQRRPILANLLHTTVHLTMPGNFALSSGYKVNFKVPERAIKIDNEVKEDKSLSGKYIITSAHHIIGRSKHETVLEVATDSTNKEYK